MIPGSDTILRISKTQEIVRMAQSESIGNPWYVSRRFDTENYKDTEYLHGDGVWRPETWHNGFSTGLFQNRDEALSAISNYEKLQGGQEVVDAPIALPIISEAKKGLKVARAKNISKKGHTASDA